LLLDTPDNRDLLKAYHKMQMMTGCILGVTIILVVLSFLSFNGLIAFTALVFVGATTESFYKLHRSWKVIVDQDE